MAITIIRNQDGNCITFRGSSNPAYWNACLSGEVAGADTLSEYVNIRNDIASASGEDVYEFFQIHYSEFRRADNSTFASAQEAADYVTSQGNVVDVKGAQYLGVWNAETNQPTLSDSDTPNNGDFYLVGTAGTTTLGGVSSWSVGDRVIWNDNVPTPTWQVLKSASLIEGGA